MRLTMSAEFNVFPNSETKEAIREVEMMRADPNLGKTYTDVDEMMEDLLPNV